jgi:hypothetical protein
MTGTDLFEQYDGYPDMYDEMCFEHHIRSHYSKVFEDMSPIPVNVLQQKDLLAGELFAIKSIESFLKKWKSKQRITKILPC